MYKCIYTIAVLKEKIRVISCGSQATEQPDIAEGHVSELQSAIKILESVEEDLKREEMNKELSNKLLEKEGKK